MEQLIYFKTISGLLDLC